MKRMMAKAWRNFMEYRERALAMIEQKVKGQEIKAVPTAPRRTGQVVNIFAAVKEKPRNRWPTKSHPRSCEAKKESVV